MKDFIIIFYSLFILWCMGYAIYRLPYFEKAQIGFPGSVAVSFGLGCGMVFFTLLLFSFLTNNLHISSVYILLLIVTVISFRIKKFKVPEIKPIHWDLSSIVLLILFVAILSYEIIYEYQGSFWWDGFAIWGFKAKVLFYDGKISPLFFQDINRYGFTHLDYPLLLPVMETWVYSHLGHINDQGIRLVCFSFYLGIPAIIYSSLRKYTSKHIALLGIILLALPPVFRLHSASGTADLPLGFFFLVGSVYLFRWNSKKDILPNLVMSGIYFGLCTQLKNEGNVMMVVAAILLLLFTIRSFGWTRKAFYTFALFAGILLLIFLPWTVLKLLIHIKSNPREYLGFDSFIINLPHMIPVTKAFFKEMISFNSWNYIWIFIIAGLVVFALQTKRYRELAPLWLPFIIQLLVYWGVYIFALGGSIWYLETSLTRTLVGIMPLGFYATLITLFKKDPIDISG